MRSQGTDDGLPATDDGACCGRNAVGENHLQITVGLSARHDQETFAAALLRVSPEGMLERLYRSLGQRGFRTVSRRTGRLVR